ncbi:hypothetical protein ANACAC_00421 [Anaerostipes caccae L1-92]|uniref:Uncharacterized protein n=1 Tax=Anaerostipes caccae (strain DSM 14662 / CCUG 47493 / JCM 13470 / NCIMB 13811 / L1-92) TaxID=411490 RepID=B0MA47_ANACD|nr:hypothetical protein ANACAC_00421 [Anaerostipes caccae L1-92]
MRRFLENTDCWVSDGAQIWNLMKGGLFRNFFLRYNKTETRNTRKEHRGTG